MVDFCSALAQDKPIFADSAEADTWKWLLERADRKTAVAVSDSWTKTGGNGHPLPPLIMDRITDPVS